jgi:hypothetical protein
MIMIMRATKLKKQAQQLHIVNLRKTHRINMMGL